VVTSNEAVESATERRLPPVTEIAIATMILVVIGGIYVASYLPKRPPLALPIVLLATAGVLVVVNIAVLSRIRPFAWGTFFLVWGWAMLAYVVIAGMLEYVFIADHTPTHILMLMTGIFVVFAVNIPLLFAFSVARYQQHGGGRPGAASLDA
jgi:hypothetical protein